MNDTTRTKAISSAGLVAAAIVAILVNVLAQRHYRRWDATRAKIYSLSAPTEATLAEIEREGRQVELFVFLGSGDPLLGSIKQILAGYQALAPRGLVVRYLDPDREHAEFLRLKADLDLHFGKTESGRTVGDAQIVARQGTRVWYLKTDDLVVLDEGDDAKVRPRVESALTSAIRAVLSTDRPRVCFTTGHHEASIDEPGPEGLSTLKNTLAKDNFAPASIELPKQAGDLAGCALIAVVSPADPFRPGEAQPIVAAVEAGASLLLVVPPMIDVEKRDLRAHGLSELAAVAGVTLDDAVAIEGDPAMREQGSLGLVFRARLGSHPTTDDLRKFAEARGTDAVVPMVYARPIRRNDGSAASILLMSSARSFALRDVAGFLASKEEPQRRSDEREGPLDLAVALERPKPVGAARGARVVVVGSSTPFVNAVYSDPTPTMVFGRTLGLLFVSWLTARPPILDLPPKASVQIALHLAEEDLGSIGRYVLLYMPLATALLAAAVWFRRRSTEGRRVRER